MKGYRRQNDVISTYCVSNLKMVNSVISSAGARVNFPGPAGFHLCFSCTGGLFDYCILLTFPVLGPEATVVYMDR